LTFPLPGCLSVLEGVFYWVPPPCASFALPEVTPQQIRGFHRPKIFSFLLHSIFVVPPPPPPPPRPSTHKTSAKSLLHFIRGTFSQPARSPPDRPPAVGYPFPSTPPPPPLLPNRFYGADEAHQLNSDGRFPRPVRVVYRRAPPPPPFAFYYKSALRLHPPPLVVGLTDTVVLPVFPGLPFLIMNEAACFVVPIL